MRWTAAPFAIAVLVGTSACEPPPPVYSGGAPAGGGGLSTPSGEYGVGGNVGAPSGAPAVPDPSTDWEGYLRAKCAQRDAKLCITLAGSYESGSSVGGGYIPQDYKKSYRYYAAACEFGAPDGCFKQGMFLIGGKGVDEDVAEGGRLVREACDRGALEACWTIRDAERAAAEEQARRETEARNRAARERAARDEVERWAAVPPGDEWFCFELVAKDNERDRTSSCERTKSACEDYRAKLSVPRSKKSKCQRQLRAACYTYFHRLIERRASQCAADFNDCEGLREVSLSDRDKADVVLECKLF